MHIQVALPHLTPDEREFLLNGYLEGEIDYGDEDDDDE